MFKRIFSVILIFAMTFSLITSVGAKENAEILVMESFDNYITNKTASNMSLSGAEFRVVEDGQKDKALLAVKSSSETVMSKKISGVVKNYVVTSVEVKYDGEPLNVRFGISKNTTYFYSVVINNNRIKTHNGKNIGGLSLNGYTKISVAYNFYAGVYTVYINDNVCAEGYIMTENITPDSIILLREAGSTNTNLYIDNFCAYNAFLPESELKGEEYNPQTVEYLPINDDSGDFTYFNSNHINNTLGVYPNYTAYPKTNTITEERYDYQNKNRGSSIVFDKTTTNDCYIDIAINRYSNFDTTKRYNYFVVKGDVMLSNIGLETLMFFIRDRSEATNDVTSTLARIQPNGDFFTNDKRTFTNLINANEWIEYKTYINLLTHKADIYINNKLVASGVSFNSNLNRLTVVRFSVNKGIGRVWLKNFEVTGLQKNPMVSQGEVMSDIFSDDQPLEEYLADKTALHIFSQKLYKNGEKSDLAVKPICENDELYVSQEDVQKIFNTQFDMSETEKTCRVGGKEYSFTNAPKKENGVFLLPVKEIARKVMGMYVLDDTNGMIILSNNKMYFDLESETAYYSEPYKAGKWLSLSQIKNLNDFLFFERPKASELKTLFDEKTTVGDAHPRLMATKADFQRIKELAKTDEYVNYEMTKLLRKADSILNEAPRDFVWNDHMRLFSTAESLINRMQFLGFAYQVTGDRKYADRAYKELEMYNTFPDFNAEHPIDLGMFCTGIAIGYDWMYDAYTPEQRDMIYNMAYTKAITVIQKSFYGRLPSQGGGALTGGSINVGSFWPKFKSNYNAFNNCGAVMIGLAFAQENPEVCFDLVEKGIRSIEYTMKGFMPEGGWNESIDYWNITTLYLMNMLGSLETSLGTDFGITKYEGFEQTGYFAMSMMSQNQENSYADHNDINQFSRYGYSYIGTKFDQRPVIAARMRTLNGKTKAINENIGFPQDLIYYISGVTVDEVDDAPKLITTKGTESFGYHEKYSDESAMYFSAKGGLNSHYHSHYDTGAFVFDLDGESWAIDLGKDNYNLGVSDSSLYRKRAEGHNTLVINPDKSAGQKDNSFAPIIKETYNERGAFVIYDMTQTYAQSGITEVKRGFYIDENEESYTIRDEINAQRPSTIYWFMHSDAEIELIDNTTALLCKNGKSILLNFATNAEEASISVMKAQPLASSPAVNGQNANEGINKIAIRIEGSGKLNLTVKIAKQLASIEQASLDEWTLPSTDSALKRDDFSYTLYVDGEEASDPSCVPVYDENNPPAVTVVPNDPTKRVEISFPEELTENISATVYSAEGNSYQIYRIRYSTNGVEVMKMYDELNITDFSVSSEPESANIGVNMFDNSMDTRWAAAKIGDYAVFDLGSVQKIDAVAAAHWKGNERSFTYDVYLSADGVNYTYAATKITDGTSSDYELCKLKESKQARYIKIVGQGNSVNNYIHILEFRALSLREEK